MWVAVGIAAGAVIGGVASNMAAEKGSDAVRGAANTQAQSAADALQLQRDQFDYQKGINQPFYDKGLKGFNAYADTVMSGVDANGKFNPTTSDSYKWQDNQLGRTLRSMGRSNSSYGIAERSNLAANEYDKQLARLADLTNIARGGASSLASASAGFSNSASQNLINSGNNQANASLAGGLMQQNGLYNGINSGMSLANLGLKAYGGMSGNQDYSNLDYTNADGVIDANGNWLN